MTAQPNLAAIILAAGFSSRMGQFKPLLPLGRTTVIDHAIATFNAPFISDIVVVVGHLGEKIVSHLAEHTVRTVPNPAFENGMFTSIQTGVAALSSGADGFFVLPADIPLVAAETVKCLAEAWVKHPGHIIRPRFNGKFGHPPILPEGLAEEIRECSGQGGLRDLLGRHRGTTVSVPVGDAHIHRDMDYPEEYAMMVEKSRHSTKK